MQKLIRQDDLYINTGPQLSSPVQGILIRTRTEIKNILQNTVLPTDVWLAVAK